MRDLKFPDVFTVIRIIKKAGISRQARAIFAETSEDTTQKEIGARFLFSCVENLGEAQEEITDFLASLKQIEKKELENLSIDETIEMISEFLNHPGLKNFLSSVSKLMK
jgi:gamma-glutamyl:cysteine ligase YbdK (ATP-grasp superfamily)